MYETSMFDVQHHKTEVQIYYERRSYYILE